jgi:hypothetical protein
MDPLLNTIKDMRDQVKVYLYFSKGKGIESQILLAMDFGLCVIFLQGCNDHLFQ